MALLGNLGESTPLHMLCKFGTSADGHRVSRSGWLLKGFVEAFGSFFNFTQNGALHGALTVADPNKFGPILTVCGGELWERPWLAKLLAAFGVPFLAQVATVTPLRMAFLEAQINSPIYQSMDHMAQFVMLGMSSLEPSLLEVIMSTNAFSVSSLHLLHHVCEKSSDDTKKKIHTLGIYMRKKQEEFSVALDHCEESDQIVQDMQLFLDELDSSAKILPETQVSPEQEKRPWSSKIIAMAILAAVIAILGLALLLLFLL